MAVIATNTWFVVKQRDGTWHGRRIREELATGWVTVFAVGVFRDEQSARNWAAGMDARCAEDRDDEILDDDQDLLQ